MSFVCQTGYQEMLQNSVTIRLDNMTQSTFLSPLFKFFQDAMATILKTEEKNIYVISIKNDSEATSKVLNVTVAVSRSDGSFQPAEYVREQIYLQRILLANLSTLQVLPFDDNFCINEPCPAFKSCIIEPIFGQAANFIHSDMMLFRPIHPKYQIQCTCPKGFAGYEYSYTCDVEIDMCYSGPCQNGGTCVRKEGAYTCLCRDGFSGGKCQYDNSSKYDSLSCPSGLCQYPSMCEPLPQAGFQCKGCPTGPEYNKFCQLTTRRFTKGSFLTFPALKKRNRFTIQMTFATQMKDGLLFYNGRFNERHDFIALEIINRQLRFSFSLGENITMVTSNVEGGISNGEWQQVTVEYHNRTVTLSVGENCDTELNVRFGNLISDYQCASRVTNVLPEICFISLEETCYKLLDLTGPFQIGGLPRVPSAFQIYNKDFDGCIKDVYIDHEFLDLNKSVANVGTQPGCREKKNACLSAPCANGGTCIDVWDTFLCKCPERTGAKDCSQVIDEPIRVDGGGIQVYAGTSLPSRTIMFPWYNGISIRTRERERVLMHIAISNNQYVLLELHGGYVQYNYSGSNKVHTFDYLPVNDGQWHYLEVRWPRQGQIILVMDYGLWQSLETMSSTIENKQIDKVNVGAQRFGTGPIEKGFIGCIQNVRVGNSQAAILQRPAESINVYAGCDVEAACDGNTCPAGATCEDQWRKAKCQCPKGTLGPECKAICQTYNPCQTHSICHGPTYKPEQNLDYTCECGTLQSGRYCQNVAQQPCAKAWYGYPICGPCNCSRELGFDTECEKSNGACICQDFHYRPEGSDRCYPCDCYKYGTVDQDVTCHPTTGQCQCKGNIIGRRCDQCDSQYAHISFNPDDTGCIITTNMCPRSFYKGIWWDATYYGKMVVQDCPNRAVGDAKRNCSQTTIWGEPDLFNCTNTAFVDLKSKIEEIENGTLKINSFVSKTSMRDLALALSTTSVLFGSDINVTYRLITSILEYENQQKGLNLTSEQDSTFIKHMLDALSIVLDAKYAREWAMINQISGGTRQLLNQLETYLVVQTENMATLQNTPFSVVSKNIVLSLDLILPQNFSGVKIPKFDNIVHKPTFDDKTHVLLPKSLIESSVAQYIQQVMNVRDPPKAYVSFIMYNTLGHLLPNSYDETVRVIADRPVVTNAPVFTLVVKDNDSIKRGGLTEPIKFHFKQQVNANRTDPQCAYWNSAGSSGAWSTSGCTMDRWYEVIIKEPISNSDTDVVKEKYVVCSCDHMTSFTLLMDVADTEYVAKAAISLAIFSIIGIGISLGCLFVTFIIFMSFKHLQCNANSIMLNLIFTIFMSEFAFIIGVNRVEIKFVCCLVAIALHYFYLSAFTWLFVEMLHLYRRLIEIREINYGAMKFYYLLGYVIPGIIVGLSVGLYTEGYGNSSFCWMDMSEPFIWSFAGPIAIAIPAIIFMFILALHASSKEKTHVSDISSFRIRIFCGIILLLLLGVSWILGLVSVNFDLEALYYVYTAFSFAQGVFIFLAYVIGDKRVRFHLKKQWYKMQGKKLENQDGLASRPSVSRSALAYRRDSIDGYINRTNVGISTTSTTSRSTSKSSGGLFKGEDYLRSTDTSTSGHVPSYTYDNTYNEKSSGMPDPVERRRKRRNRHDSDSESDVSVGDASLELASSHSSDEDDEFDIGPSWEKELPTNKKIEEAKEQARQKKREEKMKDVEQERNAQNLQNMQNNGLPHYGTVISSPNYGHWPGDPNLTNFHMSESDYQSTEQPVMSSVPPDVTLPAQEYKGMRDYIMPPVRSDSLMNDASTISNQTGPFNPVTETRMKVQVLTHNGSISSDTE
ncbi:hypothetical protein FSP39_019621 [Pinctada imbricata]|uniref:Uncharacterized protein n=1 Tax=Pinctada imbricata TaxID=66713 RepID=A0AA88YKS2_PINIB|nr:hypothetical protein FSP39_019621 [Pinctada imbricata]